MTVAGMAQVAISPLVRNTGSWSLSLPRPPSSYLPSVVDALSFTIVPITIILHRRFAHSTHLDHCSGREECFSPSDFQLVLKLTPLVPEVPTVL